MQLPRLHLARVRGNPHAVERDHTMVRRRPADAVALFFSLAGEAFFYHDDGVRIVQPGQLLMCDADRPFMRGFSGGLEELVVKVPRALFAGLTGVERLDRPAVVDFAAANPVAGALAREVGAAARSDDPRPVDEEALLQLIAALAGGNRDGLSAAHRAAARTYIDRHLADPTLSAARIAAAVGLSRRHLSRVFAEAGPSVPQYVLARRLEAARSLLASPAAAGATIAEIARRCGFTSAAHFSNAFRSRYGERATDTRRRTLPPR